MKAMRAKIFRQSDERGAALLEFAIGAVIFLSAVFGVLEVGRLLWVHNSLVDATRRAARYAVIKASTDGWIGDAELSFDVLDDAAVLNEDLDEGELIGAEALEAPELEAPLDLGVAAPAVEPCHCQLVSTHRAATDDGM